MSAEPDSWAIARAIIAAAFIISTALIWTRIEVPELFNGLIMLCLAAATARTLRKRKSS